ncbi:PEP/pyruvate-binding domain-containing protein [Maridesulfovibrio salexigens]|uniref:Phosphoenolpyruvate synthase n=1 Tax=Maridesulfovibrio salexigens (strain ATCC 14822 / DSM 2638 / NCIMB 8403 / VKM B-1763) TaxID=526222 RepID=C6BW53_MARSD|nr:PEP/pyruvate-binding domain-containing protein [Maridesulfovibrio salexigens]ACS80256.1 Pyruvate, water dikinase [Maridesulfovibrio salexigens DSM 2638]
MSFFDWLPFGKKKKESIDPELARQMLTDRYNSFRMLIQANTRMHEYVAELEEALRGYTPYGMHYVRAQCTRISVSTYQMIKYLNELKPDGYLKLYDRFEEIQERIAEHIEPVQLTGEGDLVLNLNDVGREQIDLCGPKMALLGEAGAKLDLNIPPGFVVSTAAFNLFMNSGGLQKEIDRRIQSTDLNDRNEIFQLSSAVMGLILETELPEELSDAILDAYDTLCAELGREVNLAVRSSALGEDLEGAAFAGQYRSILNVGRASLTDAVKEVMASKYSLQAMAYRNNRGLRDEDMAMSVGCIEMIHASSSGVAYSRSPVNVRDRNVNIYSVWGLPKAVVDGSAETDEFIVSRGNPAQVLRTEIAEKNSRFVCDTAEGVCATVQLGEEAFQPSLSEDQALLVSETVIQLEDFFGIPQDIEWTFTDDGTFVLLQCRPLLLIENDNEEHAFGDPDLPAPLLSGGKTASPGVGIGPVFAIRKSADKLSFPDGGVMVLKQALPNRAALLDRCSAVITEQGGLAGHLANVAREFGVPALFGVKDALEKLESGQIVTVDADGHAVYSGSMDSLVTEKPRKRLMKGSPVQASLRKAARYIVRLNLTDSDSPDFRPSKCRTYHDIMRFCHEMAVREMFGFGISDEHIAAASRQLVCNVPRQFWILDLGNGVSDESEINQKCVFMEHVRSIPMRALWAGMQAVVWDGPPAIHGKGLMSVMFEATMNPNLNVASRSSYTQKNYFMISENYCCLQSRFGFHFCSVESLVGERTVENYASFQFKGGAANPERRILRARFIGEILEELDFRVRIREDNLNARLEGLDRQDMEYHLKVLGYLITHTRQLDMIMTSPKQVETYRQRFFNDFKRFEVKDEVSET